MNVKLNKILIIFIILTTINLINGYASFNQTLTLSTFINDCSFGDNLCNITVYSNKISNDSLVTKPVIYFKYKISNKLNSINKPVTFFGISQKTFIFYRSINDQYSDLPQQNKQGYQITRIPNLFGDFILPTNGYILTGNQNIMNNLPYYHKCRIVIHNSETELTMCLSTDEENKIFVVLPYDYNSNRVLGDQSNIKVDSLNLKKAFTSSDVEQFNYYYLILDVNKSLYVGLSKLVVKDNLLSTIETDPPVIETFFSKQLKNLQMPYDHIIGIVGYNDSMIISGNHPSNKSLIVYSYNFTSEKIHFVYSNKLPITHTIQPQFSTIVNGSKICLFFSNITNTSVLFDIEDKLVMGQYHININISQYHNPNSYQDIGYFISPYEYLTSFDLFTKPGYEETIIDPEAERIGKTITPLKSYNNATLDSSSINLKPSSKHLIFTFILLIIKIIF